MTVQRKCDDAVLTTPIRRCLIVFNLKMPKLLGGLKNSKFGKKIFMMVKLVLLLKVHLRKYVSKRNNTKQIIIKTEIVET